MSENNFEKNDITGFTVWITGLPYSRKKRTAQMLSERLRLLGYKTEILIGGEIRKAYEKDLGFTREEIQKNVQRIAFECKLLSENGIIAIAVTISPFRDQRRECRRMLKRFVEVYHKCPLNVLKKRDSKGLFEKAERHEIQNVAGVTVPYEEPQKPEVIVYADKESPFVASNKILTRLQQLGLLEEAEHSILLKQEEKDIRRILRETWFK